MTDWYIRLQGEIFDLKILADIFNSKDLNITEKEEHYYLYNKDFCNLTDSDEVNKKAYDLLSTMNGIARLKSNKFKTVISDAIIHYDENGHRTASMHLSGTLEMRSSVTAVLSVLGKDGKIKKFFKKLTNKINAKAWVKASFKDDEVKKALRFFGKRKLSWSELYKIYEIIIKDIGDDIYNWVSKSKIRNFRHTANSFGALGDEARHGYSDNNPPLKPMSFEEARSLITTVLTKWIEEKTTKI